MKKEMNNKGFSLVELIIVIAIMAVLMGVLAPQYLKYVRSSKVSTDITNAENVATAINAEIADGKTSNVKVASATPTASANGITVLVDDGSGRKVYLPDSKLNPGANWEITYDDKNGVTEIKLNSVKIWPEASAYN